jgi:hypothetical protein
VSAYQIGPGRPVEVKEGGKIPMKLGNFTYIVGCTCIVCSSEITGEYKVQLTASIGALPRKSHHTDHFTQSRCNLGITMLHGTSLTRMEDVITKLRMLVRTSSLCGAQGAKHG